MTQTNELLFETKGNWENSGGDNHSIDIVLPNDATISIRRYSRYSDHLVMDRSEMELIANMICLAGNLAQRFDPSTWEAKLLCFDDMKRALEAILIASEPQDNLESSLWIRCARVTAKDSLSLYESKIKNNANTQR